MGIQEFKLEFERAEKSYFAGEIVRGSIQLQLKRERKVKELRLHWSGIGKIFSGFSISSNSPFEQPSLASHTYFESVTELISPPPTTPAPPTGGGGVNGKDKDEDEPCYHLIPEGLHCYPFQFQLPSNCASSFQEPYAQIRYSVEATLLSPSGKHKLSIGTPFTVNGLYDLNNPPHPPPTPGLTLTSAPNATSELVGTRKGKVGGGGCQGKGKKKNKAAVPAGAAESGGGGGGAKAVEIQRGCGSKELRKMSSKFGPLLSCLMMVEPRRVGFHLQVPKVVFVPGEFIQFSVEMFNMSKDEVSDVTLTLYQESKYFTGELTKSGLRQKLCSSKGPSVSAGSTEIWETNVEDSLFLQIPSVPPTNLCGGSGCPLVSLNYYVQFEMGLRKGKSVVGAVPIIVGTVPLKGSFHEFITLKSKCGKKKKKENGSGSNNNNAGEEELSIPTFLGYPELSEPYFEEAALNFSISAPPPPPPSAMPTKKAAAALEGAAEEDAEEEESWQQPTHSSRAAAADDFEFIPKYVNYTSVFGLDIGEQLGAPSSPSLLPTPPKMCAEEGGRGEEGEEEEREERERKAQSIELLDTY